MAKIMVVDDEPDILYLVSKMLKNKGYVVVGANSGEKALEILEETDPDLIILDVMMPGISGWETSKRIKQNPRFSSVPIAMLTVKSSEEDMEKSFQFAHCNAHISKPIIREKMMSTVQWLLKNAPKNGGRK
ncbi:MAG TPA: response regulator [Euryarchaeota archaeon]|nr:response regulator [Euryarchaeota archaeon]